MKKILVIEDNLEMRENIEELLQLKDYEVQSAENGSVGIEKALVEAPDLIICDIMMPEKAGYEVLATLSDFPQTATIPFIFLSAKADKSDLRKGMNLGADDYLTKPFEDKELYEAVKSRLIKSKDLKNHLLSNLRKMDSMLNEKGGLLSILKEEDKKPIFFDKKEILYSEDESARNLYFIKSGKVKMTRSNVEGKELITGIYTAGNFLGHADILNGDNHKDSAVAIEKSEVVKIPSYEFVDFIHNHKDAALELLKMLSIQLGKRETELLEMAYSQVRKRVGEKLLSLVEDENFRVDDSTIKISREDLAALVGTSTETLIRTLAEMKSDNLIEIKASTIKLLDIHKLGSID